MLYVTNTWASISVDYTCEYTQTGITTKTTNPIDKVLERMEHHDLANDWHACAIGRASALTFLGNEARQLTVKEKDCKPKVFKITFTPGAAVNLSSNLNHHNTKFKMLEC